ncbi:MAG: hypothetical protein AB3A66_28140 (plasmid) [Nodularia sp. CChRGM 3473]
MYHAYVSGWTSHERFPIGLIGGKLLPIPGGKPVPITQEELGFLKIQEASHGKNARKVTWEEVS